MPGVFGLACQSSDPGLSAQLAAMAGRLRHHSWYTEHRQADPAGRVGLGRVSLGLVNTAPQPAGG